jgi:hypothetical protein
MWRRALARRNITMHGILRAEALHNMKTILLKLGIMGCGHWLRWEIYGVFKAVVISAVGFDIDSERLIPFYSLST